MRFINKTLITLVLLILAIVKSAFGQVTPLETRLRAKKINDYLVLRFDPLKETMKYETDPITQNKSKQHSLEKEPPTEFVSNSNKTNIDLSFLNPFKYQITVNTEFTEDPVYKNVKEYTNRVSEILTMVTGEKISIDKKIIETKNIKSDLTGPAGSGLADLVNKNKLLGTSSWYAWYLQMNSFFSEETGKSEASVLSLVKDVLQFSTDSYSILVDTSRNQKKINRIVLSYENLPAINTYKSLMDSIKNIRVRVESYNKELEKIDAPLIGLKNAIKKSVNLSKELVTEKEKAQKAMKSFVDPTFKKFNTKNEGSMLVNYTQVVATEYVSELETELAKQKKLLEAMSNALDEVEHLAYDADRDAFILSEVGIYPLRTSSVTVQVSTKDDKGKDKTAAQSLRISEYSLIVPEFSLGMAFTNINYSTFGLESPKAGDSTFTVTKKENHTSNYAIIGMLNLVPVIARSNYYPVIQLGAGITGLNNTLPLLGVGAGVRMFQPTDLSITFGLLWHWEKQLQDLSPGSKVTTTDELTNDLEMRFVPKANFYLGIQYHF